MKISEQDLGPVKILALEGDLDRETAVQAESAFSGFLARAGEKVRLILDLGRVDYICGRGLTAILALARGVNRLDGRMAVCGLGGYVKEVFDSSHLSTLLLTAPDLEEALERF